jgi:hypothetical protein
LEFAVVILNVFSHGPIEIQSIETNKVFKINGHKFNPFVENFKGIAGKKIKLVDPIYEDA